MLKTFNKLKNAKTSNEFFSALSPDTIEKAAAAPLFLLMLTPVIAFFAALISKEFDYYTVINISNSLTAVFGLISLLLSLGKLKHRSVPLKKTAADNIFYIFFIIFALLIILSDTVNGFNERTVLGDGYRGESFFSFITYVLFYFGCGMIIKEERIKKLLMQIYIACNAYIGIFALLDKYDILYMTSFHMGQWDNTLTAHFFQYNHYAYYLMFAVIISAGLWLFEKGRIEKWLYLASFIFSTLLLVINKTRGCYLACIAGFIFLFVAVRLVFPKFFKKMFIAAAIFAGSSAAGMLLVPQNLDRYTRLAEDVKNIATKSEAAANAGSHRWTLWKLALGYVKERPLLGWGTEGIYERLFIESNDNNRPHNEYIQYAAFYGIPAVLFYIAGLAGVFVRAVRHRASLAPMQLAALAAAFTYAVSAIFGNTMFYTAPFFFVLLGMGVRNKEQTAVK